MKKRFIYFFVWNSHQNVEAFVVPLTMHMVIAQLDEKFVPLVIQSVEDPD